MSEKILFLPPNWSANFANEEQLEKSKLTKEFENLALHISKLKLEQNEMQFEDYLIEEGELIIEAEYNMSMLVHMASGQRVTLPSFDLNA